MMTSHPPPPPPSHPFNVEVPRELSSYVSAPQTSTLKGERREIISYTSWDHRVPTYYAQDCKCKYQLIVLLYDWATVQIFNIHGMMGRKSTLNLLFCFLYLTPTLLTQDVVLTSIQVMDVRWTLKQRCVLTANKMKCLTWMGNEINNINIRWKDFAIYLLTSLSLSLSRCSHFKLNNYCA